MRVQKTQKTTFKSQLKPTPTLRYAFERSVKRSDINFLRAVSNIMNDGKNHVVTVNAFKDNSTGFFQGTHMYINEKLVAKDETPYESGNASIYSLMDSARNLIIKSFGSGMTQRDEFSNLSVGEVKNYLEKIKKQIFVE